MYGENKINEAKFWLETKVSEEHDKLHMLAKDSKEYGLQLNACERAENVYNLFNECMNVIKTKISNTY